MLKQQLLTLSVIASLGLSAQAETQKLTAENRESLNVTIYQSQFALFDDVRNISPAGEAQELIFDDVSNAMLPSSAVVTINDAQIFEQYYNYNALSQSSLLAYFKGQDVQLKRNNNGELSLENVTILSATPNVILKTQNGIEVAPSDAEFIFPYIPEGVKPAFHAHVNDGLETAKQARLTYLSQAFSWDASYTAVLNKPRTKMAFSAMANVQNTSDIDLENIQLQLVAGDVNLEQQQGFSTAAYKIDTADRGMMYEARSAAVPQPSAQTLSAVELYTFSQPISIEKKQQKSISLMDLTHIDIEPIYYVEHAFHGNKEQIDPTQIERPLQKLKFKNVFEQYIPGGNVAVYEKDNKDANIFVGQYNLDGIAPQEEAYIYLGEVNTIGIKKALLNYSEDRKYLKCDRNDDAYTETRDVAYELIFSNASAKDETVNYKLNISNGTASDLKTDIKEHNVNVDGIEWSIQVPAQGETKLNYSFKHIYTYSGRCNLSQ